MHSVWNQKRTRRESRIKSKIFCEHFFCYKTFLEGFAGKTVKHKYVGCKFYILAEAELIKYAAKQNFVAYHINKKAFSAMETMQVPDMIIQQAFYLIKKNNYSVTVKTV